MGDYTIRWEFTEEQLAAMNEGRHLSDFRKNRAMCPSRVKSGDGLCKNVAGFGTSHPGWGLCKWHGGLSPMGKKNAALLMGATLKEEWKMRFGGDRTKLDISPEEALLEEVRRSAAFVQYLESMIGTWNVESVAPEPDALPGYKTRNPSSAVPTMEPVRQYNKMRTDPETGLPVLMDETVKGTPTGTEVDAWLRLYREERVHLAKAAKMAIDAGIAERQVRLVEDQAKLFATGIRTILSALNLTAEQAALVPQVVPHLLRQLSSGEKPSLPATLTSQTPLLVPSEVINEEGVSIYGQR